jgi:hypothetical protein
MKAHPLSRPVTRQSENTSGVKAIVCLAVAGSGRNGSLHRSAALGRSGFASITGARDVADGAARLAQHSTHRSPGRKF